MSRNSFSNRPELWEAHEKIKGWLKAIYGPSQIDKAVHVRPNDGECGAIHVKIWTSTNEYRVRIVLKPGRKLEDAYMGAGASTRKPRAGETWTRGNDLPDGKFSEELWHRIMVAIVRYEAQEIKSESDEAHRDAVLLGNLNYQVENGGFGQWVDNGFGAEIAAVRDALQRLGSSAAQAVDALLSRLEPHINIRGHGADRWVMGEPYEYGCPDCGGDPDTDCDVCLGSGLVEEEPDSEGWEIAKSLNDEYDAVRDALAEDVETWLATRGRDAAREV